MARFFARSFIGLSAPVNVPTIDDQRIEVHPDDDDR